MVGEPAQAARQTRRAPGVPRHNCRSAGKELTPAAGVESFHPAAADGGFTWDPAISQRSEPAAMAAPTMLTPRMRFPQVFTLPVYRYGLPARHSGHASDRRGHTPPGAFGRRRYGRRRYCREGDSNVKCLDS